jgi:prophage maintenance system killer protein
MNDIVAAVKKEHARWSAIVGAEDPYVGRYTIGLHEVLQAHFLLAEYFAQVGEGIGGIGPKDLHLLHSARSRQTMEFGGTVRWSDRIDVCATLMFGLIKNHPFHDANKRTAFLTSLLHLQKIGRTTIVSHRDYEDFTVAIADNKLAQYDFYERMSSPDKDIKAIAHFLKRSTRNIDLASKIVTYQELNRILGGRGLRLESPRGNRIALVRLLDENGRPFVKPIRIAHVGFHGWTKQASMKDINIIREAAKLDAKHGYDSQSFFNGLDDPLTLIRKYREPLERLAYR